LDEAITGSALLKAGREPRGWQEALIGAGFALVGVGIVELLLFVGETPLGPVGWPTLGAIFASALYGVRGLLGALAVLSAYYLVNAIMPGRFPAFFASPLLTLVWVGAGGLICGLVLALRGRLAVALHAEMREIAAKHGEERFRHLTQLSSDWYWEQDENFRFTFVSASAHDHTLNPAALIGKHRWDFPALNFTAEDWARHRARRTPGRRSPTTSGAGPARRAARRPGCGRARAARAARGAAPSPPR
jgi:PAS domain-containing protein